MHLEASGMFNTNEIDKDDLETTVYDVFEINLKDGGRHSPAHSFMA